MKELVLILAVAVFGTALIILSGCAEQQQETNTGQGSPPRFNEDRNLPPRFNRDANEAAPFNRDGNAFLDRMKQAIGLPGEATMEDVKRALGLPETASQEEAMRAFTEKFGQNFDRNRRFENE